MSALEEEYDGAASPSDDLDLPVKFESSARCEEDTEHGDVKVSDNSVSETPSADGLKQQPKDHNSCSMQCESNSNQEMDHKPSCTLLSRPSPFPVYCIKNTAKATTADNSSLVKNASSFSESILRENQSVIKEEPFSMDDASESVGVSLIEESNVVSHTDGTIVDNVTSQALLYKEEYNGAASPSDDLDLPVKFESSARSEEDTEHGDVKLSDNSVSETPSAVGLKQQPESRNDGIDDCLKSSIAPESERKKPQKRRGRKRTNNARGKGFVGMADSFLSPKNDQRGCRGSSNDGLGRSGIHPQTDLLEEGSVQELRTEDLDIKVDVSNISPNQSLLTSASKSKKQINTNNTQCIPCELQCSPPSPSVPYTKVWKEHTDEDLSPIPAGEKPPHSPSINPLTSPVIFYPGLPSTTISSQSPPQDHKTPEMQEANIDSELQANIQAIYLRHVAEDGEPCHKTAKRQKLGPKAWKQNRRKELREKGQAYVSKGGKTVPARMMKAACSCTGRFTKCQEFTDEDREAIFKHIWTLSNDAKRAFIKELVYHLPVKRRRMPSDSTKRLWTLQFNLKRTSGEILPVCKSMFLNTTALTRWFIRTCFSERCQDLEPKVPRSAYYKRAEDDKLFLQNEFLKKINKPALDYCREDTYVESKGQTVRELYQEYKVKCEEENRKVLCLTTFKEVFRKSKLSLHAS